MGMPESTSLTCLTSSLFQESNNESDEMTTTALITTTMLVSSMENSRQVYMANQYIDSLSDTEIVELDQRLQQKEAEMMIHFEEPKSYQKTMQ